MFEKFTRHLSGKENDGAKTGESFKIATPGSSLDCAYTGSHPSMVPIWKENQSAIERRGPSKRLPGMRQNSMPPR